MWCSSGYGGEETYCATDIDPMMLSYIPGREEGDEDPEYGDGVGWEDLRHIGPQHCEVSQRFVDKLQPRPQASDLWTYVTVPIVLQCVKCNTLKTRTLEPLSF